MAQKQISSGNFTFTQTSIDDVIVVDVKDYPDDRGYFMETYKQADFEKGGINANFVQDNQSCSTQGVLRGLHFQINHPQAKLVRVVEGEVFDVAVDLRSGSKTFGQWEGVVLSAENKRQFFVPRGFAHGFYVMSECATFVYKVDDVYHPNDEGGIAWDDPDINVAWPLVDGADVLLSEKDKHHMSFKEYKQQSEQIFYINVYEA